MFSVLLLLSCLWLLSLAWRIAEWPDLDRDAVHLDGMQLVMSWTCLELKCARSPFSACSRERGQIVTLCWCVSAPQRIHVT